ncbi:MAG: uridine monophosphate kinase [Candidatus Babeliales bacterium]
MSKKIVLLKITGEILVGQDNHSLDKRMVCTIADQIKALADSYYFGIVIGGGNFFRGSRQGKQLGLTPSVGHQVGMLATMMNGLIVKDIFESHGLPSSLFCAVPAPEIGAPVSHQAINSALAKGQCLIFSGGTGNPFFSTDTTAVLRALQIEAHEVWKGTLVDGVYADDPRKKPDVKRFEHISYKEVLDKELGIMDLPAIALAQQHRLPIRVFDIFKKDALLLAASDPLFGSTINSY